jgi:hypothetical protein
MGRNGRVLGRKVTQLDRGSGNLGLRVPVWTEGNQPEDGSIGRDNEIWPGVVVLELAAGVLG